MKHCMRCGAYLMADEEELCAICDSRITGLPPVEPPFKRASARLIWRAKRQLEPLQGSDDIALKSQLREAARLLLAACHAIDEER